jgi:RimJ/RimL family protein N-acetyltransferase
MQGVGAERFAVTRAVSSGSWLGRPFQGVGTGRLMRAVMLEFAFTHLGATQASSSILDANERSRRVSLRLGYQPNGTDARVVRDVRRGEQRYLLEREAWLRRDDRPPLRVEGLNACLGLLGGEDEPRRHRRRVSAAARPAG